MENYGVENGTLGSETFSITYTGPSVSPSGGSSSSSSGTTPTTVSEVSVWRWYLYSIGTVIVIGLIVWLVLWLRKP